MSRTWPFQEAATAEPSAITKNAADPRMAHPELRQPLSSVAPGWLVSHSSNARFWSKGYRNGLTTFPISLPSIVDMLSGALAITKPNATHTRIVKARVQVALRRLFSRRRLMNAISAAATGPHRNPAIPETRGRQGGFAPRSQGSRGRASQFGAEAIA